ncbi:MAG TPA: PEP/pyruvate-binding domain-containing protein [Pseudomonadales bacterium]|nr:PEP/pyruvate-binding domain-containing protein [Pseudomonadales bacterium]
MSVRPVIIPLQDIRDEAVGGKAEGLARLIALGLHVPPGFVIQHARPGSLPEDIFMHYNALGSGAVAVRSSAIGEDSVDASFAGQYETILNVEGDAELIAAIEQCLHSIQSVRASSYLQHKIVDENPGHQKLATMPADQDAAVVPAAAGLPEYSDADLVIEDFDDVIVEVFIEEAEEVLETLNDYYPRWRANHNDKKSLTEVRRAFHTLKGSGRMVKANELGELAWSIENLLNKIINGPITADENICIVIDRVIEKVPSMVEAFSKQKMDPQPALSQRLITAANSLAMGEGMLPLDAPAGTAQPVAVVDVTAVENAVVESIGIEPAVVEMAVVVQKMVRASCAGVLFTADPVTNSRNRIVIDVVAGLGEKLVSGEATPDHYVMDRKGKILEQELLGTEPLLSSQQLDALLDGALHAERQTGHPLDMEWAFDEHGVLCWLQARPITTLGADLGELNTELLDPKHIYTKCNVSEALPGALCPLTHSVTGRGLEVGMQRLFIDFGILKNEDEKWYVMGNFFGHMFMNLSSMAWTSLKALGTNADDLALAVCGRLIPELNEGFVKPPLYKRIPAMRKYFGTLFSGARHREKLSQQVSHFRMSAQPTAVAQWQMIDNNMDVMYRAHHSHLVSSTGSGMMTPLLLGVLAKGKPPTDEHHMQVASLLAGAENVESADIALGATRIQQQLLDRPQVREQFVDVSADVALRYLRSPDSGAAGEEFSRYLARHGHRSISEMDIRMNEWAHDPMPLVQSLQNAVRGFLQQGSHARVSPHATSNQEAMRAQNFVVRYLVRLAQKTVQGREQSKSHLLFIKQKFKQAYRELAAMMVQDGLLPDADVIYFLTHDEIGVLLRIREHHDGSHQPRDLVAHALQRRHALTQQQQLQFPDISIGVPQPIEPDLSQLPGDKIVRGRTVSRGRAVGRARTALVVSEAVKLEAGDILIAPITDIAWTPYFSLIGGLATDIGSAVSHGAVVAREYGLPAIVKTDIGTRVFDDGEIVVLDADHGILRPASADEVELFLTRQH